MNTKSRKSAGKSRKIGLGTAVAIAMGVSSGLATANTDVGATDHEIFPVNLNTEQIDEALSATSQALEGNLMVADRAFGLSTAATRSGRTVPPPKKKAPPKKRPIKKKATK